MVLSVPVKTSEFQSNMKTFKPIPNQVRVTEFFVSVPNTEEFNFTVYIHILNA